MKFLLNKIIILLSLSTAIVSCSGNDENASKPKNLLSDEIFTKILVDFSLAESTTNLNVKNVPMQKMDSVYTFNPLKENNVSRAAYDSAIAFYSQHPALYKKIYENVLTTLSKIQAKSDTVKATLTSK